MLLLLHDGGTGEAEWQARDLVTAAGSLVDDGLISIVPPGYEDSVAPDAIIWCGSGMGYESSSQWPSVPAARVVVSTQPAGPAVSVTLHVGPTPASFRFDPQDFRGAVRTLAIGFGMHWGCRSR